jgi:large subunit ribosomal protein L28
MVMNDELLYSSPGRTGPTVDVVRNFCTQYGFSSLPQNHGRTRLERPNSFPHGAISGSMKIRFISKFSVGSNVTMALVCEICGKKPSFGNTISHAHNVRRRRWNPNLRRVKAVVDGVRKHVRVCTACIRSGRVKKAA